MKNMVLLWTTRYETLYHEDQGATLKHKCGKKDSSIAPFYLFIFGPFFFWPFFFLFGLSLFFGLSFLWPFSFFWDNALLNDDHHTSIYLQLNDYNSILEQTMTLYECLRRYTGIAMMHEWHVWKNYERWLCHKYDVNYMIMQSNMTMMERVIVNGTVESCMEIYLGMAMEMPW